MNPTLKKTLKIATLTIYSALSAYLIYLTFFVRALDHSLGIISYLVCALVAFLLFKLRPERFDDA